MSDADFTLVGLVFDVDTGDVVRIVWPTQGDHELEDPEKTMFALDPAKQWALRKVPRDSQEAQFASAGVTGGSLFRLS